MSGGRPFCFTIEMADIAIVKNRRSACGKVASWELYAKGKAGGNFEVQNQPVLSPACTPESLHFCLKLVETYLGRPGLVRETSRVGAFGSAMHRLRSLSDFVSKCFHRKTPKTSSAGEDWSAGRGGSGSARAKAMRAFEDVVLSPDLKEQVSQPVTVSVGFEESSMLVFSPACRKYIDLGPAMYVATLSAELYLLPD